MEFVQPVLIALLLLGLAIFTVRWGAAGHQHRALGLLLFGTMARLAVSAVLHQFGYVRFLASDSVAYESLAVHVEARWERNGLDMSWLWGGNGGASFRFAELAYTIGMLYYLCGGPCLPVALLLMALLSSLAAVVVYLTTAKHFTESTGWAAGCMVAFFPSSLLWGSLILKEAPTTLGISLCCSAVLAWTKHFRLRQLVGFAVALLLLRLTRTYVCVIVLAVSLAVTVLFHGRVLSRSAVLLRLGLGILFGVLIAAQAVATMPDATDTLQQGLSTLSSTRIGMTMNARTAYLTDTRFDSITEVLWFLPQGMAYFLLSPFPWQLHTTVDLMMLADLLPWYVLLAYAVVGLFRSFRGRYLPALTVLMCSFLIALTILYSLISGNSGTAMRHRVQLLPFFAVLALKGGERVDVRGRQFVR